MFTETQATRSAIGIITGSGPEAGLDLWKKVLQANKDLLEGGYRGDLDAPNVSIMSVPELGLSMELQANNAKVWDALSVTARSIADQTDYYAIACNTLNYYQPQLEELDLRSRLVSFSDVVIDMVKREGIKKVALLGAKPVTDLGDWSPYRKLVDVVEVEVPEDTADLHNLIYDVKIHGGDHANLRTRFSRLLGSLNADTVLLACTELPLILVNSRKNLVDVTDLVAKQLALRSLQG
ncbi:MAG: aspartate/glutamate racemase family protein [Motiliproteus sp.]